MRGRNGGRAHGERRICAAAFRGAGIAAAGVVLAAVTAIFPGPASASTPTSVPSCGNGSATNLVGRLPQEVPFAEATQAPPPPITAKAAVVIDGETGRVLYDLRARDRMPPASTTKIMTAILALEAGDLQRVVTSDIDASTMTDSSVMGLRPGVTITVQDLLFGLMLPSGNDAAIALARNTDGTEAAFVARMNRKAQELGLKDTQFMNPHGLDQPGHYSSAYDLSMLARYGMDNPDFRLLVSTQDYRLGPPLDYELYNGNSMLQSYPGADGVKIGWTEEAGWTLVTTAQRDGRRLYVTVLNSENRDADASALLDWAFANYRWARLGPTADGTLRLAERFGLGASVRRALSVCG